MNGIFLMLFGLIGCFVGIVFLFFNKIRTKGVLVFGISIISILMGYRSCKGGAYQSYSDAMEQYEWEQQVIWNETVENTSPQDANILIKKEIDRIKKELVEDSLEIYEKYTKELILTIRSFENGLVNDMNLKDGKNYPFKAFDFEKLVRFKEQKQWVNSTKFVVPISESYQVIHVSGILSNDSSCIVYEGFLNLSERTVYWTRFQPEELIVTDCNNYYNNESPNKILDLTNSSKELRVNHIYWEAQSTSRFLTKDLFFRKNQEKNIVQDKGEFIPLYKISKIKDNGKIDLRDFYNY